VKTRRRYHISPAHSFEAHQRRRLNSLENDLKLYEAARSYLTNLIDNKQEEITQAKRDLTESPLLAVPVDAEFTPPPRNPPKKKTR